MSTTSPTSAGNQSVYDILNGTNNTSSTKSSSASKVDEQQSRFLKLLTTQLKNQDPLNPMDNAQTTSQLAQISTVDGVERLNSTLATLVGNIQSSDALQAASLVGRAVLVEGPGIEVVKGMAVGGVQLGADASQVTVTITDANGLEIKKLDLGKLSAGTQEFVWDGKNEAGTVVADGKYTMKVTAMAGDTKVTASTLQLASVNSVITSGSEVKIDVGDLGRVSLSDIKLIL
ncbi:MAG: flagellar hook assembly protein FlgD [Candidatus Dactylopiibacterium sp.]|nr:flagellar hook assembly protein FlgD [Candidatus Dactylopiibacterium sp.]